MTQFLLGAKWVSDNDGHFVHTDQLALRDIIQDYDPTMSLVWIPPEDRMEGDTHPWGILHEPGGNIEPYIIFTFSDAEMDNRAAILDRLWRGDQRRHNVMEDVNNYKRAQEILKLKAEADAKAELEDIASHIWRSKLHTYRHNGVTYRD